MIITYLRSSSYNTWDFCQFKYYLDYVLAFRSPANQKAEKGTIVHKGLELLAKAKFAKQNGKDSFYDEEFGYFEVGNVSPDIALQLAYQHIANNTKHLYKWAYADFKDCQDWLNIALTYNKGMFHPYNQNIVEPEKYFDIIIDKPWAKYKFKNGLEGNLGIKGTLDLVVKINKNTYELVDYKTGQKKDWNTGKEKDYNSLMKDPQLLIYYYAMRHLFPEIKHIIVTIFYIRYGGPVSMHFNDDHFAQAEKILEKRFSVIKNTYKPKTIYPNWKCDKLCHFGRNDIDNQPVKDYNKSACKQLKTELLQIGIDKLTQKHGKDQSYNSYGQGGGTTRT